MKKTTYHIFFSNLASPLRVDIISQLRNKEMCVMEISKSLRVEQSKLSHALSGLRECNLVNVKQKGKKRVYSLNKKTLIPILRIIDKHSRSYCGGNCSTCLIKHPIKR